MFCRSWHSRWSEMSAFGVGTFNRMMRVSELQLRQAVSIPWINWWTPAGGDMSEWVNWYMAHTKQLLSRDEMNSIEVVTNKSKVERYIAGQEQFKNGACSEEEATKRREKREPPQLRPLCKRPINCHLSPWKSTIFCRREILVCQSRQTAAGAIKDACRQEPNCWCFYLHTLL